MSLCIRVIYIGIYTCIHIYVHVYILQESVDVLDDLLKKLSTMLIIPSGHGLYPEALNSLSSLWIHIWISKNCLPRAVHAHLCIQCCFYFALRLEIEDKGRLNSVFDERAIYRIYLKKVIDFLNRKAKIFYFLNACSILIISIMKLPNCTFKCGRYTSYIYVKSECNTLCIERVNNVESIH